jgi:outer membrane lipoprotein-sorting protein
MRKILLLFALQMVVFLATAQYTGYSTLVDADAFRNSFSKATSRISTIKSDFTQEKNLSMLAEKINSRGKFWFKKESQVRMEYTHPYQYLMVINKDRVLVKDKQKESKINTRSNKMFQQINRVMIDCMQGTVLNNQDFNTKLFENKSFVLIEMNPVVKGLKEMFRNIVLIVDKKDFSVLSINMTEPSGDNTLIKFVNKELNVQLQDNLFSVN